MKIGSACEKKIEEMSIDVIIEYSIVVLQKIDRNIGA